VGFPGGPTVSVGCSVLRRIDHSLSVLCFVQLATELGIEPDDERLDVPSAGRLGQPAAPVQDGCRGRVGEYNVELSVRREELAYCHQLEYVLGDFVDLTALQLSLPSKDLDIGQRIGTVAVDVDAGAIGQGRACFGPNPVLQFKVQLLAGESEDVSSTLRCTALSLA